MVVLLTKIPNARFAVFFSDQLLQTVFITASLSANGVFIYGGVVGVGVFIHGGSAGVLIYGAAVGVFIYGDGDEYTCCRC